MRTRNQVFISYAHHDAEWRDAFTLMFNPAIRRGSISLWSDDSIPVGASWSTTIDQALESASVGLLLVTPHFLNSEFINDVELRRLLNLARTAGVTIHWVPVSSSLYTETPLREIQASWTPERPLDQLADAQRGAAIQKICQQIVEDFGFLPKVSGGRRQRLPELVQSRLGDEYEIGEEVGGGKLSIVYRAQQKNPSRIVGVKVFVASEFDDGARLAATDAVQRGAELTGSTFIRIIEHSMEQRPEFLVTEFIQGEPLSRYLLQYPNGAPLGAVRTILLGLAHALEEIHQRGWTRGEVYASNVIIEPRGTARLSAVEFSAVLREESQTVGNFLVDSETLAYMTPERFLGLPHSQLTDQYSLGLLAMELLGGERLPRVFAPCDLEDKRRLFGELESGSGRWARRSPEFAGFVSRLLRVEPVERWPSMREARHFLRDIDVAESEDDVHRKVAKASYLRLQLGDANRTLFRRFYQNLFTLCPDVAPQFATVDMERQSRMLNVAIQLLLDFDPARGSEKLRDLATRHAAFGLNRRHYDLFLVALLTTMEESGVNAPGQLEAWRKTLTPAVQFMCECQGLPAQEAGSPTAAR